ARAVSMNVVVMDYVEVARLRGEAAAPDQPPPDQPKAVEDRRPPPAAAIDIT
ncbi:MAG: hypothetical protein IH905_15250, partial [Proteobacteria bacterium]|nr:hypothetical protein [Pseudomonadota bacterium]